MGVTGRPFDVTKIADLVFLLGLASDGPRLIATGTAGGTTPVVSRPPDPSAPSASLQRRASSEDVGESESEGEPFSEI